MTLFADMNTDVPICRKTLAEVEREGLSTYCTRTGKISFDVGEIRTLCASATSAEKTCIRIPLMIYADVSSGQGTWKIEGNAEASVISKLLGKHLLCKSSLILYNPDMAKLRRMLPGLTFTVFKL